MLERIGDRQQILDFLSRDPFLHLYSIGDLDDFFWPHTRWFARSSEGRLEALFLLYTADVACPTLLAFEQSNTKAAILLLHDLVPALPRRFRAHVSQPLTLPFRDLFRAAGGIPSLKMRLERGRLVRPEVPSCEPVRLKAADAARVLDFYSRAYPENYFDPRMLETGHYLGIETRGKLVAVAGVHVYSARYRVAAIGNIATLPDVRRRGFATTLTHRLCSDLFESVDFIGLNVRRDNRAAVCCYERLGFETHCAFEELEVVDAQPVESNTSGGRSPVA